MFKITVLFHSIQKFSFFTSYSYRNDYAKPVGVLQCSRAGCLCTNHHVRQTSVVENRDLMWLSAIASFMHEFNIYNFKYSMQRKRNLQYLGDLTNCTDHGNWTF